VTRPPTAAESALIEGALVSARQQRPYYGRALSALTPIIADGLGSVAVDRRWRLYVDPVWLGSIPLLQRGALLGQHEIEHVLRDHGARAEAIRADRLAWNVAGDAEINDDADPDCLPPGGVTPALLRQPPHLLAEEYYSSIEIGSLPMCGGGSGAGRPLSIESDDDTGGAGVSDADAVRLRDQVAADVREHARVNGRGSVPSGILVWADARATTVKIPWHRHLRSIVARMSRSISHGRQDWSWSRLSRRSTPILRPGSVRWTPRIGVVVDTSGSMSERGADVLGVVRAAVRGCGASRIWQVDTEIHGSRSARKTTTYRGGGGTDLRPAMAEAAMASDAVIVVTDCDTPWPDLAVVPTLIVTWHGCSDSPHWAARIEVS
jgi:predicted metal-dependent peptidase